VGALGDVRDGEQLRVGGAAPVLLPLGLLLQHHGAGRGGVVEGAVGQGQRVQRRDQVVLGRRGGGLPVGGRRVGGGSCGGVGGAGLIGHACSFGSVASASMLRGPAV